MSFPRYPQHEDSGVEWLGEVPKHWSVKRIGYYFKERREKVIVVAVERELQKFDALTVEAQRAVDLLQERRTALISAAVTGQIDVREIAVSEAA